MKLIIRLNRPAKPNSAVDFLQQASNDLIALSRAVGLNPVALETAADLQTMRAKILLYQGAR